MDPRYPIGKFQQPLEATPALRQQAIEIIAETPAKLRAAVEGLSPAQLDTPYREGGWTVRQLVHHVADSHANSYVRVKMALTEANPTIFAYDEAAWARLPDSQMPIEVSLPLIDAIHARLVSLLKSMSAADYEKTFRHPERGEVTLANNLALYDKQ